MTDWPSYNRYLVRRGEILFSHGFLDGWDMVLAKMNENKKGRKFVYPDSFILAVGYIRICFHLPYRQTEGIIKATGKSLPSHPSYAHMCKRVNSLKANFNSSIKTGDGDDLVIAVDSTGVRVTNRASGCMRSGGLRQKQKEERLPENPRCR